MEKLVDRSPTQEKYVVDRRNDRFLSNLLQNPCECIWTGSVKINDVIFQKLITMSICHAPRTTASGNDIWHPLYEGKILNWPKNWQFTYKGAPKSGWQAIDNIFRNLLLKFQNLITPFIFYEKRSRFLWIMLWHLLYPVKIIKNY